MFRDSSSDTPAKYTDTCRGTEISKQDIEQSKNGSPPSKMSEGAQINKDFIISFVLQSFVIESFHPSDIRMPQDPAPLRET